VAPAASRTLTISSSIEPFELAAEAFELGGAQGDEAARPPSAPVD
jgi:hypothetical protein